MKFDETTFIVRAKDATEPFEAFLVTVYGGCNTSASAQAYERNSYPGGDYKITDPAKRSDFDDYSEIAAGKDWDGITRFRVKTDGHNDPDKIALMLKTCAFLCDQAMAEERFEWDTDTWEDALASLNCGDGADENPGIIFEEFIPLPEAPIKIMKDYTQIVLVPKDVFSNDVMPQIIADSFKDYQMYNDKILIRRTGLVVIEGEEYNLDEENFVAVIWRFQREIKEEK
jgi:hypothetical protein